MNVRDLFPIIPSEFWGRLEEAATKDWMMVLDGGDAGRLFRLETSGLSVGTRMLIDAAAGGGFHATGANNAHVWFYTISRVIAEGPKVFRPTAEQCLSLEHVSLGIPIVDYRQPYPTMLVEFPRAYREDVDRRTGGVPACPRHVVIRHWSEGNVVMTGCQILDKEGLPAELVYLFGARARDGGVIEDVLGIYHNSDPAETALLEAVTRVALNLMLLLSQTSSRLVPSNPDVVARCRAKLRKGVRPDLQRREISGHVNIVVPDREIVVRETRTEGSAAGGTHASPHAHWRRGHWRAAPGHAIAKGRGEKVPLVFVRPCLVMGAGGEPAAPVYSASR